MDHNTSDQEMKKVDTKKIKKLLARRKGKMKRFLSYCAHCSLCAESCFLYRKHKEDPKYMPSFKVINSLGRLYRKRGKVDWKGLNDMKGIVWRNCVLCGRCYCPIGIHVPSMIAFTRAILRSQDVYPEHFEASSESWL
jgi:Fe-S oxidoreductase